MKAGEWMYLCVAHGNDGAMEASLVRFHRQKKEKKDSSSNDRCAAMLRHRLHFTHSGQRDSAPQLTTSVPVTVCATRALSARLT
jgi:hypothetical protein